MTQKLPIPLLDLIEHVELNQSGWWDAALGNVLLAAIWMQGRPVCHMEIHPLLESTFILDLPQDRIAEQISRLILKGELRDQGNGYVVPSSSVEERFNARLTAASENEDKVRATFIDKIGNHCTPHTPQEAWNIFTEHYLLPCIEAMGARSLELMGGSNAQDSDLTTITNQFVHRFDPSNWKNLRTAIS